MAFELNLRIGRNREEKRSLPSEEEKIVEVRDKTAREQPVSVKSPEQAMRLSTAFRCTDILSGTIASLPLYIKRKEDAGNYKVDAENELHYLLTKKPNKRMNSYDLICNAIIQMVNRGNSYIFIKRMFGDTAELILCSNNSVTYDIYRDEYTICDVRNRIYVLAPSRMQARFFRFLLVLIIRVCVLFRMGVRLKVLFLVSKVGERDFLLLAINRLPT